jgi:hypothetical protein
MIKKIECFVAVCDICNNLVDDEEEMLELCERRLEECGCNLCGNTNCTCLAILLDDEEVFMSFAHYYITFAMKTKYEQDSIILDWYKYRQAAKVGSKHVCYCLPYDVSWCFDSDNYDSIFEAAKGAKLCTLGMRSVMEIGNTQFQSIRAASAMGVMPRHKLVGRKSNSAIKDDDPRMVRHLKENFAELHTFAEDRAIKVIITGNHGERGCANRLENDEKVYLPIHMGYRNCYYRYCASLGYSDCWSKWASNFGRYTRYQAGQSFTGHVPIILENSSSISQSE